MALRSGRQMGLTADEELEELLKKVGKGKSYKTLTKNTLVSEFKLKR